MQTEGRTRRIVFVLIILAVVLGGVFLGSWLKPFHGRYSDIGLIEIKGTLDRAQLFCNGGKCKWLWKVKAEEVNDVQGEFITPLPSSGDTVTIEVEDSRANLFVRIVPIECYQAAESPVSVCEHEIVEPSVTVEVIEKIGSSGQPEFSGVPH